MALPPARFIPSFLRRSRLSSPYPYMTPRLCLVLVALAVAGAAITEESCRRERKMLLSYQREILDTIGRDMRSQAEKSLQVANSFSGSPRTAEALAAPGAGTIAAANELLDRYAEAFAMSVCYLLNPGGTVIASSNRASPESFVGSTFMFRPYVARALAGEPSLYFAYGAISRRPGLFAAVPVRDRTGALRGAAAVKDDLGWLRARIRAQQHCFLADPNGIILFASSSEYGRRPLWPVAGTVREELLRSRQFGGSLGEPVFSKQPTEGHIVSFEGEDRYFVRHDIGLQGWALYSLVSAAPVRDQRYLGWMTTGLACLLTVLLAMVRRQASMITAARAHYASLLDSAVGIAIFAADSRGIITVFNPGAEKMLGYSAGETIGKLTPLVFHASGELEEYGDQLSLELGERIGGFGLLTARVRTRRSYNREWSYVKKDGTRITVSLLIARQEAPGRGAAHFLFVATDITQRKRFEEALLKANNNLLKNEAALETTIESLKKAQEEIQQAQRRLLQSEKLASIGQLSAGLAHEIDEPIGFFLENCRETLAKLDAIGRFIAGLEGTARKSPDADLRQSIEELLARHRPQSLVREGHELLQASLNGTERVQKTVRDLRLFSSSDSEERRTAEIGEILGNALNMVAGELRCKAELVTDYRAARQIECNAAQLGQVFINILINAAQAIRDKGVITVSTYDDDAEDIVCVEINDTGEGMAPEVVDRIFDPFFTTKSAGKGTGLGLSVCLDIIRKHGGAIDVVSEPGAGTTFTIRIPAV